MNHKRLLTATVLMYAGATLLAFSLVGCGRDILLCPADSLHPDIHSTGLDLDCNAADWDFQVAQDALANYGQIERPQETTLVFSLKFEVSGPQQAGFNKDTQTVTLTGSGLDLAQYLIDAYTQYGTWPTPHNVEGTGYATGDYNDNARVIGRVYGGN